MSTIEKKQALDRTYDDSPIPLPPVPRVAPDLPGLRFSWLEFSGGLGDLGLFIPLVVAMSLTAGLDLGMVLICAGLMNVVTGFVFRQPIPVQPMKAIAVVVIAEGLARGEMMAAGLLMGLTLLLLGLLPSVVDLLRRVPPALVRGIQLGVGIKLAGVGIIGIASLPVLGLDSLFPALGVAALVLWLGRKRFPLLLSIFIAGLVILFFCQPALFRGVAGQPASDLFSLPPLAAWQGGLLRGFLPQLPLTLLNSVLAICALSGEYFPGQGIAPRRMTISVGLMNLICVPFGGIPMCHGSGGLAAQYGFGARTGGSVIMLGGLKIAAGLIFGGATLALLQSYPRFILGPMLVFAGLELARVPLTRVGRERVAGSTLLVLGTTALVIVVGNTWIGFLAGVAMFALVKLIKR